jgi:hypothetical protein
MTNLAFIPNHYPAKPTQTKVYKRYKKGIEKRASIMKAAQYKHII